MYKSFFYSLLLIYFTNITAQNLVKNPSFEETKRCTAFIGEFNVNMKYWSAPTLGTTDLFDPCLNGESGVPNNYNGVQIAKEGEKYAGFYLFSDDNYREYVQGVLYQKLKKGAKYKISFYVSLAEKSDFAIKNIDFLLSEKRLYPPLFREISDKQLKKINTENYNIYRIDNNEFYTNKYNWVLISQEFEARGNERFFIIGNFYKNSKTDKVAVSRKNNFNMSYYYIDMVSIEPLENELVINDLKKDTVITNTIIKVNDKPIEYNKKYILQHINFRFNSIILSELAQKELNDIIHLLNQNKDIEIKIIGHTDDVGSTAYNQDLSESRAKKVADYLVNKGIALQRVSVIGKAETEPIASNTTEEGRKKNRRVEFVLKKN